ncbi:MAG: glutamate formimidoyltransferase, partial [Bacteroidia bacterium]|nr:glutamate formimidoyltransferase [Bacteroidia bacterium]
MEKIVTCIPNFSEGRNQVVIDKIAQAIASAEGVRVLGVEPGASTNRTVITFAGSPESVIEGAFRGIAMAAELIDMTQHTGAHPRMGATDVCTIVPIANVSIEEAVEFAKR